MKVDAGFYEMMDRLTHDKDGFTKKDAQQVAERFGLKDILSKGDYENFMKLGGESRYLVPDRSGVLHFNSDVRCLFNTIDRKIDDQTKMKFLRQFQLFFPGYVPKDY